MAYFNFGSFRKVCCSRKFVFLKIAPFKRLLFGNYVWLGKDETLPAETPPAHLILILPNLGWKRGS